MHARVPRTTNSVSDARQQVPALFGYQRRAGTKAVPRISACASSWTAAMSRERARRSASLRPAGITGHLLSALVRGQGVMIFIDCARHAAIRCITRACPNGRNEAMISRARSDTSTIRPPGSPRPQRFSLLLCRPAAGLYSHVDLARTRTGKERKAGRASLPHPH